MSMSFFRNVIVRRFRNLLSERAFRILERIWERKLWKESYGKDKQKILVWMQAESVNPGGLSDRLLGMVSAYKAAEILGIEYKIEFLSPFNLSQILRPNRVNWSDYSTYKGASVKPLIFRQVHSHNKETRQRQLIRAIQRSKGKEIHLYTNLNIVDDEEFHRIFHHLFIPSEILEVKLREYGKQLDAYCSVTFRFQQLLGDFKEGDFPTLSEKDQKELIELCLKALQEIHSKTQKTLLVTSDSLSFLERANKLQFVKIVEGKVIHMAYTKERTLDSHLKSFLDLLLISKAETVYSVCIPPMYNSGFPRLGAKIGNRPFKLVTGLHDI